MDTASWQTQLRKGAAELVALSLISKQELYGPRLLEEARRAGPVVSAGTLYPLLNRLERDGKLRARWSPAETGGHMRKYYSLTTEGEHLLKEMTATWVQFRQAISSIVEDPSCPSKAA